MNYAWLNQSLPLISHTRCSICPPSRKYYRLGSHPLDVSLITISKSLSISTPQIIRLALHCLSLTTCFLDTFSTNTLCSEAWPRLLRITASAQTPLKRWKSKVKSQKKKKKSINTLAETGSQESRESCSFCFISLAYPFPRVKFDPRCSNSNSRTHKNILLAEKLSIVPQTSWIASRKDLVNPIFSEWPSQLGDLWDCEGGAIEGYRCKRACQHPTREMKWR